VWENKFKINVSDKLSLKEQELIRIPGTEIRGFLFINVKFKRN